MEAARAFVDRLFSLLELLAEMPAMSRASDRVPAIRRIAVTRHLMLYYALRILTAGKEPVTALRPAAVGIRRQLRAQTGQWKHSIPQEDSITRALRAAHSS